MIRITRDGEGRPAASHPAHEVEEPLAVSAPLAREYAVLSCAHRPCRPYHAFWQYMRLMGLGKTLSGQSGGYLAALERCARDWANRPGAAAARILISGSADYSLLAHLVHACRASSPPLEITVLDVCATPLLLNQWYARRVAQPLSVVCADILDHRVADAYDLILTSSFLGYFHPRERPRLLAGYARMLRPGGCLVIANRLRSGAEEHAVGFSAPQVEQFAARAAELSAALPAAAGLTADEAVRMARAYAGIFRSYPLNSGETLAHMAAACGLRWAEGARVPSVRLQAGLEGPTVGDGSDYLLAVLER